MKDGDEVYIETKMGRVKQRLVFDRDIDPRVVFADFGWWFPEDPSGDLGWDWGNINMLTSAEGPVDPAVGVMVLRGVPLQGVRCGAYWRLSVLSLCHGSGTFGDNPRQGR